MNDYYKTENKYSLTKIPQKSIIKISVFTIYRE